MMQNFVLEDLSHVQSRRNLLKYLVRVEMASDWFTRIYRPNWSGRLREKLKIFGLGQFQRQSGIKDVIVLDSPYCPLHTNSHRGDMNSFSHFFGCQLSPGTFEWRYMKANTQGKILIIPKLQSAITLSPGLRYCSNPDFSGMHLSHLI